MVKSDWKTCEIITLELEWINAMMNDIQLQFMEHNNAWEFIVILP
jgi:hypothetical protein